MFIYFYLTVIINEKIEILNGIRHICHVSEPALNILSMLINCTYIRRGDTGKDAESSFCSV
jgi:hypothetical protein